MNKITIRLSDSLRDRLIDHAFALGVTPSALIRDILIRFEGADPPGYHARFDELQATALQSLAILGALTAQTAPAALEKAMTDARILLRQRGLIDPE